MGKGARLRRDTPLFHHAWTDQLHTEPPETAVGSPLLALHGSSDVDPLTAEQVGDAREILRRWKALVAETASGNGAVPTEPQALPALRRRVVERFLAGRAAHFGPGECSPFGDVAALAREGRDIFVVVKFMDEAAHLRATLTSLLNQTGIDLGRVVIVTVDNNSRDGSDEIVKDVIASNRTAARFVSLVQHRPGAGHAARLGVDRSIATVHAMCEHDGDWRRLRTAVVAVSDGDTVYHHRVLEQVAGIFERCPTVDAVMPFLVYKVTAALRLFANYRPALPEDLPRPPAGAGTLVPVDLSRVTAFTRIPRWERLLRDERTMEIGTAGGGRHAVDLVATDPSGRRFGVLRDAAGHEAYLFEDRTLVLEQAPVSGADAALVFLENSGVRRDEKWRWHAVVGHDVFLQRAFGHLGFPEEMVFPDTSDALKAVRVWAFAIGGQHQLRRPGLRIATGSDYQSGRVLQAVGCTVRLATALACAETEPDRLTKMIRNLVRRQAVFYGQTRSPALERATGLYVHMTRIQREIEEEIRAYDDEVFEQTVFPERMLFLARWVFQNAIRFYAHPGTEAGRAVRERLLEPIFADGAAEVERRWFAGAAEAIRSADRDERLSLAEDLAEDLIAHRYGDLLRCYRDTLAAFFAEHRVAPGSYGWLLEGLHDAVSALANKPQPVNPAAVWDGSEFVIDAERGQVTMMRRPAAGGDRSPSEAS